MPDDTADTSALAQSLRPALLRLARRIRQGAQARGLSHHDVIVLNAIQGHRGIGVSDLADREQVSRPTMSAQIKRLEAAGYIERSGDANDGRRFGFALTPSGARKVEAIRRERNDWLARRLALLSAEDRERVAAALEPLLKLGFDT